MTESFDAKLHDALIEACRHIEWLATHAKTSESGNAAGVVVNAKQFLDREDVKAIRVAHARIEAAQKIAATDK